MNTKIVSKRYFGASIQTTIKIGKNDKSKTSLDEGVFGRRCGLASGPSRRIAMRFEDDEAESAAIQLR